VEDLLLSQEGNLKKRRSACKVLRETGIPPSSVYRIIHRDLHLKCFKRHYAQLLSEVNRVARLSRCKTTLLSAINLVTDLL